MPIRPEERARYPADWPAISLEVRERAGWACEGSPAYPDCRAANGEPHPVTGSRVVLTVGHLNHTPEDNGEPGDRPNLKAWCQRCHNTYDAPARRAGIAARAALRAAEAAAACALPERIQRSRGAGARLPPAAVYVGRPSMWGNPFTCVADPQRAVEAFRRHLGGLPPAFGAAVQFSNSRLCGSASADHAAHVMRHLHLLRGKPLACWCAPGAPCHADVLLELANA